MLDVIDKGSTTEEHPVPLLFVHGAFHAAWCWDEHFLDFFAQEGYRALAINLRGHGKSPAPRSLTFCSVDDYVDDVESAAASLPTRPIVIGHSLGGFVVQRYLESHDAPAGVLVASVPPRGIRTATVRMAGNVLWHRTKAAFRERSLRCLSVTELGREAFFAPHASDTDVYAVRLQPESARAALDSLLFSRPRPERVTTPILVLGGDRDRCFSSKDIHATARAYRTTPELVAGVGHGMMVGPGWLGVAQRIGDWLGAHSL